MERRRRHSVLCLTLLLSAWLSAPVAAAPARYASTTAAYARVLRTFNPRLSPAQSRDFAQHVRNEALYYRLDARLLVALVAIESSWHPYVTSPVGAGGLGQLMPGTAAGLGVDAYAPYANLSGTAHYLRGLLNRFGTYNQRTRYSFALAGYNAGPGAVERYGGIPPYSETQNYVRNVMGVWHRLCLQLSPHIDDYLQLATAKVPAPRQTHVAITRKRHPVRQMRVALAQVIAIPEVPKKKPFLYYLFHRHHAAPPVAASSEPDAQLQIGVPSEVAAGDPIEVELHASGQPVTLLAFIGNQLVARAHLPSHTGRAVIKGLPSQRVDQIIVVHAYAPGYDEAHAPVRITARTRLVLEQR